MQKFKFGLLPKVIVAIILGILAAFITPTEIVRAVVTLTDIFGKYLSFIIPLIIIGLVAPGIADLGKGAGRLLAITVIIAYASTLLAGFFSYFTTSISLPFMMERSSSLNSSVTEVADKITSYFSISIPPIVDVMSALVLAFILGLTISAIKGGVVKAAVNEFKDIINIVINKSIIPLLPFYIFGIFLKLTKEGQVSIVLGLFFKVILIIFAMHVIWLLFQYMVAWLVSGKNPFRALYNMLPAYMTALGTQSSAATIPVTRSQVSKNGVNEDIADFVVPLCATIHLAGSTLKITACAYALMWMLGLPSGLDLFTGFIFMLGVIMVAAPGVPGGAIMAATGILQSMLGFDQTNIALMIALYITMDSFGTACNVTGDGAIAIIIDKIYRKREY